jgi:ribosomal protein L11 methyltransferase
MATALRLRLASADEDRVATELWEQGTTGFECRPLGAEGLETEILAHFPDGWPLERIQERLTAALPDIPVDRVATPEVDWLARFRERFGPFEAAGFTVVPAWKIPASALDRVLIVEPGRAFGTGTHESTRLCLALMQRLARGAPLGRVADIGTGTAILAIAASKLGASLVVGSDIDPEAIACAREHLRLNPTPVPVHLAVAAGTKAFTPKSFDTLIANLSLPLLKENADDLGRVFARHAILSGVLIEDLPELRAALAHVDAAPEVETMGGWAALLLSRGDRP